MATYTQLLQDVDSDVDHSPLSSLAQWLREYDHLCIVGNHYVMMESTSVILDLQMLIKELSDWFADDDDHDGIPNPPDIREWLAAQVAAGRTLAWISY